MAYINSILIEPQESAAELAAAAAAALAKVLGWTLDGSDVWQNEDKSGIRLGFFNSSSGVYSRIGNSAVSVGYHNTYWYSDKYYRLYYYSTGSTTVYGISDESSAVRLSNILAKNSAGEFKALQAYGSTTFYEVGKDDVVLREFDLPQNNKAGVSTSIVRAPDIWGGCMFEDLYILYSCPDLTADMVFYLDGKYYRYICGTNYYAGFAIRVG